MLKLNHPKPVCQCTNFKFYCQKFGRTLQYGNKMIIVNIFVSSSGHQSLFLTEITQKSLACGVTHTHIQTEGDCTAAPNVTSVLY